ncbi:hypothetical protein KR093_005098 [Drosophila rubida]|uniref:Uncharacterized protein n=1 Tax=Drosophila rubida TaxID=30044 RepID=A0AAD4PMU4_9MUSC|nr:hypothetical protein KR093_005098 [Drosophila rubida]
MLSPTSSLALAALQGQKWQQVFDLDKMIKQLRAAEKTQLRGGGGAGGGARAVLQVQRLNAADMGYYDMVPKQAARDIVVCNACNGSYTKAGFNNHIALQHPNIWDAVPNKLSTVSTTAEGGASRSAQGASLSEHNSLDGQLREPSELLGSPTDTLSATMSSCSNGSSSSLAANNSNNNVAHVSSSSAASSSTSSSRHKSSSSKSSSSSNKTSSSSSTSRSRSKSSKNRHHSELHHKVAATAGGGASSKKSASAIAAAVAAAPPLAVKDEAPSAAAAAITVFSSSSNSSCSLPTTPAAVAASNGNEHANNSNYSPAPSLLEETLPSKKKLKAAADHRSKPAKEKQLAPLYDQQQHQQLSELDQAVCSITAQVESQQQPRQHQVDLSAVAEEPLPMHNTSDDNSISLTLDDMLDSKFINEILNTVESEIPFDESALDTSQSQSQSQQQQHQQQQHQEQHAPATKRLRYDDGTINADPNEYATALYHQQQQQVFGEESQQEQEPQLTAINAMQLQQLIYQQQQMLEADQQQQQQQQLKQELSEEATAQFSVYDVPSLTDDAEGGAGGTTTATDEHMMLPSIIYEITDNNQVSVLDQQSQQQVIAEFLTQAGYDNVDVNVLTTTGAAAGVATDANHFNDELCDFDFTKLETVSAAEANNNHTKTVKLEAQPQQPQQQPQPATTTYNSYESEPMAQPHRQLVNAKYHEDAATYFNMTLYAGPPRPLAMNTFGLVKLPNGMGATLRKNLLMTRKANHGLLSLNGTNGNGIVGTLARPPPLPPSSSSLAGHCNGSSNATAGHQQVLLLPRNPAQGKTIYAQKCSIIAQERLRCNKRTLMSRLSSSSNSLTVKRLNDLLAGKLKPEKQEHNEASDQQQQLEQLQQQEQHKRMHSFYEKRRKLLASRPQRHSPVGGSSNGHSHGRKLLRQRPLHLPLQLQSGVGVAGNPMGNASPQHQLLKKQLLRTLSDNSNICSSGTAAPIGGTVGNGSSVNNNNNNNPWKSNSSTPGSSSASSDLMRVFV